jgi:hypothetical protein
LGNFASLTYTTHQAYTEIQPTKKWNFPKAHSHAHLFDDIENKGSTINFNTKYSEKKHKSQKEKYALTNFKDVEKQVACPHPPC